MKTEQLGGYEVEYAGVRLSADGDEWIAKVAIFGTSTNPMHRNPVFPSQRVLPDRVFDDEKTAEQEARKAAIAMLANS